MNSVGLGLIGLGTVGTGVVKIIEKNKSNIAKRVGADLKFVQFCDKNVKSNPAIGISSEQIIKDYKKILDDDRIDIVIELIGGYEPARTIVLDALNSGKHVVTANKAVLAKYWDEIFLAAQKRKRLVYFEAAVGGGIPVIQGLNEGLAANKIKKIVGILNGTTNYILCRMREDGLSFQEALKQAQNAGFAETDPTFDIKGIDSAHKLAILSSIAFGGWIKISDVYCEGITDLNLIDLQLAEKEFGYGLKLLGIAKENDGQVEVRVHPAFLPNGHPFLSVKDEYNAVSIVGDAVSDVMFYGKGAGQMTAASAVVSDIIFLARQVTEGTAGKLSYITYDPKRKINLLDRNEFESKYYLRFTTLDRPGVLSKISGILGKYGVSIASVYQPKIPDESSKRKRHEVQSSRTGGSPLATKQSVPILLITHKALEGKVQKAIRQIDCLPFVKAKTVLIRIEE